MTDYLVQSFELLETEGEELSRLKLTLRPRVWRIKIALTPTTEVQNSLEDERGGRKSEEETEIKRFTDQEGNAIHKGVLV